MRTQRELVIDRLDKHGSSMRRFLAGILKADTLLARALLGIFLSCLVAERVLTDPLETVASETATPAVPTCDHAEDIVLYQSMPSSVTELTCQAHPIALTEAAAARAYLIETARPGYTMTRQGPELAIGRLHPAFVVRLANAVREARQAGLTSAGVYSAYRPPAFGIGGFVDKFHSLHTYGLAVDVHGIGGPGTPEAQLWHDIAHGGHSGRRPFAPLAGVERDAFSAPAINTIVNFRRSRDFRALGGRAKSTSHLAYPEISIASAAACIDTGKFGQNLSASCRNS